MNNIDIYTDGACSGNPGPGGWAAVLISRDMDYKREISGFEPETTNNRMEILSVLKALQMVKKPSNIRIYSDSAYVVNAFRQNWIASWQRNGWVRKEKKPVLNKELWQELLAAMSPHNIEWIKVAGHADNELNNRCDELARAEIKKNT